MWYIMQSQRIVCFYLVGNSGGISFVWGNCEANDKLIILENYNGGSYVRDILKDSIDLPNFITEGKMS